MSNNARNKEQQLQLPSSSTRPNLTQALTLEAPPVSNGEGKTNSRSSQFWNKSQRAGLTLGQTNGLQIRSKQTQVLGGNQQKLYRPAIQVPSCNQNRGHQFANQSRNVNLRWNPQSSGQAHWHQVPKVHQRRGMTCSHGVRQPCHQYRPLMHELNNAMSAMELNYRPTLPANCIVRHPHRNVPLLVQQPHVHFRCAHQQNFMVPRRWGTYSGLDVRTMLSPVIQAPTSMHPQYVMAALPTSYSYPNLNPSSETFCRFCLKNKESFQVYSSHQVKDEFDRVTCPVLRSYICDYCGATGDNAHTHSYCPLNRDSRYNTRGLYETPLLSSGRKRPNK